MLKRVGEERKAAKKQNKKKQSARRFASKICIQLVDLASAIHKSLGDEGVENKHGIPKEHWLCVCECVCVCVCVIISRRCVFFLLHFKGRLTTADGFIWLVLPFAVTDTQLGAKILTLDNFVRVAYILPYHVLFNPLNVHFSEKRLSERWNQLLLSEHTRVCKRRTNDPSATLICITSLLCVLDSLWRWCN